MMTMGASVNPEVNQAMSLLSLLADPKKAAAKIEEYNAAKTLHDAALEAVSKAKSELEVLHDNLTIDHAKREVELAAREAALNASQTAFAEAQTAHNKQVDDRLAAIAAREKDLRDTAVGQAEYASMLTTRAAKTAEMSMALDTAEKDIAARQEAVEKAHHDAMRAKALHEEKLAKLAAVMKDDAVPLDRNFNTGA